MPHVIKWFITSIAQATGEIVIKIEWICQINTDGSEKHTMTLYLQYRLSWMPSPSLIF